MFDFIVSKLTIILTLRHGANYQHPPHDTIIQLAVKTERSQKKTSATSLSVTKIPLWKIVVNIFLYFIRYTADVHQAQMQFLLNIYRNNKIKVDNLIPLAVLYLSNKDVYRRIIRLGKRLFLFARYGGLTYGKASCLHERTFYMLRR